MPGVGKPNGETIRGTRSMNNGPLRIVHCFRAPVGGLFRHVSDLVQAQARAGHAVGIICDSSTGGAFEDKIFDHLQPFLALGVKRFPMRRQIAPSDFAAIWRLLREVRSLDPDILHAHGAKGGVYARVAGTLSRVIGSSPARFYTPHGGSLYYDPNSLSGKIYFAAERILERMTDGFIFVSEFEAEAYRSKVGAPARPVELIRNGLRPEEYEVVVPGSDAADFLLIGELVDRKGLDTFIEALAAMSKVSATPPTAVIVGDGADKARYQAMTGELGLSDFVSFRKPMRARQAFELARTVVVPSRAESMPYIVLEAIGAGMPVIASKVGGIPEIFGKTADRLIPPGDATALARAMTADRDAPQEARTRAADLRSQIEPQFTVENMVAPIEAAYRAAILSRC